MGEGIGEKQIVEIDTIVSRISEIEDSMGPTGRQMYANSQGTVFGTILRELVIMVGAEATVRSLRAYADKIESDISRWNQLTEAFLMSLNLHSSIKAMESGDIPMT